MDAIIKILEDEGFEVKKIVANKNGVELEGISLGKEDGYEARPTFYKRDMDLSRPALTAKIIIEAYENSLDDMAEMEGLYDKVSDWTYAHVHLILCVSGRPLRDNVVTREFLDLVQYMRVDVGHATVIVDENLLKLWGHDSDEAFEWAEANSLNRVHARSLRDIVANEEGPLNPLEPAVISLDDGEFGAAIGFLPETLDVLSQGYNTDLYIIPSSVHEVIVTPIGFFADGRIDDLQDMIAMINDTIVDEDSILSNSLYKYSIEDKKLSICQEKLWIEEPQKHMFI